MRTITLLIILCALPCYAADLTLSASTTLADVTVAKTDKLIMPKDVPLQKMETVTAKDVDGKDYTYVQPAGGKPALRATIHHHYKPGTNLKEATTTMMLEGKYYTGTTTFDVNRVATFSVKDVTESPKADIGAGMETPTK